MVDTKTGTPCAPAEMSDARAPDVADALSALRTAADASRTPWLPARWTRSEGPGSDELTMVRSDFADVPVGALPDLRLEPGHTTVYATRLDLPSSVGGVALDGEPLELCIHTVFPVEIHVGERVVLVDDIPAVATGPALVELVPSLLPGYNGELRVRFLAPENQIAEPWAFFQFTTPSTRKWFERLDVAWAQLFLADAVSATDDERNQVAAAAAMVPDELTCDLPGVSDALAGMAAKLESLDERVKAITVHLVGHSHIDLAWLWQRSDAERVVERDLRTVVALMDEFPELTFTHSQPAGYMVIRDQQPHLFARIRELIAAGRWEPATMQWVESDSNLPSGEAHARQLLEGVSFTRDEFGTQPVVFLAPDTFGHAGNLPQLAASAGARFYYHHRANPGQSTGGQQWPLYWWEGDDGTRILGVSSPTYMGEITAGALATATTRALSHGHAAGLHFHGIGDHGGGPTRLGIEALRRLQTLPLLPTARCTTVQAYASAVVESGVALPVHRGESATIFEGCYTTHADAKRYNRYGENLLVTADTLAVISSRDHTPQLTDAWRRVLFNQFHDILDGSSIAEVYAGHRADYAAVQTTADEVIDDALATLHGGLDEESVAVTNPLGVDRTDVVRVPGLAGSGPARVIASDGVVAPAQYGPEGLVFVADIPAFATRSFRIKEDADWETIPVGEAMITPPGRTRPCPVDPTRYIRIDTPVFDAVVRKDNGILVSLIDKRVNRQVVPWGKRKASDYADEARPDLALNVLQLIDERPHQMSAWRYAEVEREQSLITGAATKVVERGPVRVVVETKHVVRSSTIVARLSFYRGLPRIDAHVAVDWHELGSADAGIPNLKVAFTANLDETEAWFETPFGAARRPSNGLEVPALRWADVGGPNYGMAVINNSKYGYDAMGCRLRLTLLRSAYEPDPAPDIGHHEIAYSLFPHPGDWRAANVVHEAAGLNQPLLARRIGPGRQSDRRPAWTPRLAPGTSVVIAALKFARAGNGRLVRLSESHGRATTATVTGLGLAARAWEANVVEDRLHELPVRRGSLDLTFRPWQVRTLIIETEPPPS